MRRSIVLHALQWLQLPWNRDHIHTKQTNRNGNHACTVFCNVITFSTVRYMLREGSPHYALHNTSRYSARRTVDNCWGRSPPLVALVAILSVRTYGCMVLYTANALPVLFQRLSCKILQSRDDCSAPTMHCIY